MTKSRMVKELEKAKKRLTVRPKNRADRESKDKTITKPGIDQLFVDEADLYKNLAYTTKMSRIAGLPNSDSNRAFDMFLKIRYLQERGEGRGVVFTTGTLTSNTLAASHLVHVPHHALRSFILRPKPTMFAERDVRLSH